MNSPSGTACGTRDVRHTAALWRMLQDRCASAAVTLRSTCVVQPTALWLHLVQDATACTGMTVDRRPHLWFTGTHHGLRVPTHPLQEERVGLVIAARKLITGHTLALNAVHTPTPRLDPPIQSWG